MRKIVVLIACLGIAYVSNGQIESSNIYLFKLQKTSDTTFNFNSPTYLTSFNPRGYNNQPSFIGNDQIYLSVQYPGDSQTDLYLLDLETQEKIKVTDTPEQEFSPNLMPTRYQFSAIRQEFSGRDTLQRLWQFPLDRLSNGKPIFKYLNRIGYYHWMNSTNVAVFITESPNYLAIADTRNDRVEKVAENVGRCFKKIEEWQFSLRKKKEISTIGLSWKKRFFPNEVAPLYQTKKIIETLPGSEDFEVLPDGSYIMALGSKIFNFNPRRGDEDWREIADFKYFGLKNITRMALSRDNKIAIVAK